MSAPESPKRAAAQPRRRFALVLEDAQPDAIAPAPRRLARLLKCLLRYYGFRALRVEETTPPTPQVPHAEEESQRPQP